MKVAIVHYWLTGMRGGEKVLEALLELYPQADIYTHVYNPAAVSPIIRDRRVYCSYINTLPFAKKMYQFYMPLMPNALMDFNLQGYDLVISSESGPAKGVVPNPDAYHICYCHSPMRYLWDMYHEYFRNTSPLIKFFMRRLIPGLRLWDVSSANMVDRFIANSRYVAKRIARVYNRGAEIVYPPVSIERFLSVPRRTGDFYLFFGQLAGYKRADIAIEACIASGRRLLVAGSGIRKKELRRYRKTSLVKFLGKIDDEELVSLFSRARALLFPGIEDFGIVPVEANAAGCPVIAFRQGGALDTVKEGVTGIFFDEQNPAALIGAMDKFEEIELSFSGREAFSEHVRQFSRESFKKRITGIINERIRV
ncbi:MAG: glycosyltransferase [Treponema sp.]|jgi:glycosyltransferase involved in cell wall biosynthesis|nr:glycosyltransferase [Treponema sp.]